jgi:hypothetical protein
MAEADELFFAEAGSLDGRARPRSLNRLMVTGLAHTLCRLFAAFVCLLCSSDVFGFCSAAPSLSGSRASQSEISACAEREDLDATSGAQDSREEREEREGDDEEDDDIDDSRHVPLATFPVPPRLLLLPSFSAALTSAAPRPSHLSLDPRPPRRA